MKTVKTILLFAAAAACAATAAETNGTAAASVAGAAETNGTAAAFPVRRVEDAVAANWKGVAVVHAFLADWPEGDGPDAKAVREWILEMFSPAGPVRPAVWSACPSDDWDSARAVARARFFARWTNDVLEDEWINMPGERNEPSPFPESDGEISIIGTYADVCVFDFASTRIVTFHACGDGQFGTWPGWAWRTAASFVRRDGRRIGWDAFADTNAVRAVIERALVEKFGDGANLYGNGIFMPDAPAFLADGFRCDYGDYSMGEPHYFNEHDEFPTCFVPYADVEEFLTDEAKELLLPHGGETTIEPSAGKESDRALIHRTWSRAQAAAGAAAETNGTAAAGRQGNEP